MDERMYILDGQTLLYSSENRENSLINFSAAPPPDILQQALEEVTKREQKPGVKNCQFDDDDDDEEGSITLLEQLAAIASSDTDSCEMLKSEMDYNGSQLSLMSGLPGESLDNLLRLNGESEEQSTESITYVIPEETLQFKNPSCSLSKVSLKRPSVFSKPSSNVHKVQSFLPKLRMASIAQPPPRNQNMPLGSSENPIQLIQRGSTFHALQPLNHTQLTEIANVLKQTNESQEIIVGKRPIGANSRIVYKVVYPDKLCKGDEKQNEVEKESWWKGGSRKRGRPRRDEIHRVNSNTSKKLRLEFGLSDPQVAEVRGSLVPDEEISTQPTESEEDSNSLSNKITRSGRISRPPIHRSATSGKKLETSNGSETLAKVSMINPSSRLSSTASISSATTGLNSSTTSFIPENKKKRVFKVPDKYRCRVCHKIYLGYRKMMKHVKLFPEHGPVDLESLKPSGYSKKPLTTTSSPGLHDVPIIPMARTQLEDLVKNLDAELVLDVVSKKMFDNFTLWDLIEKKYVRSKERGYSKGLSDIQKLFDDLERLLFQIKRLFDSCFTVTKLSDVESKRFHIRGEILAAALNASTEEPLYLEDKIHIPKEFKALLGLESSFSSEEDEDEDSLTLPLRGHGGGAQMVLEQNLGVLNGDEDDDDESSSKDSESEKEEEDHVDPKRVLEQNGINTEEIGVLNESEKGLTESSADLALEIESLASYSRAQHHVTPLPSFSTIIAGSPKTSSSSPPPSQQNELCLRNEDKLLNTDSKLNGCVVVVSSSSLSLSSSSSSPASSRRARQPSSNSSINPANHSNDSSFLDYSSVLDFGFHASALNPIKTPEKLLRSIPPSSMMVEKDVGGIDVGTTRTNFLGALTTTTTAGSLGLCASVSATSVAAAAGGGAGVTASTNSYDTSSLINSSLSDPTTTLRDIISLSSDDNCPDTLSVLFNET